MQSASLIPSHALGCSAWNGGVLCGVAATRDGAQVVRGVRYRGVLSDLEPL